jgi:uncharacterized protein (DUF427 family)
VEANYPPVVCVPRADNAVWTYELPKTEVGEIGSQLAFYPDKVETMRGR